MKRDPEIVRQLLLKAADRDEAIILVADIATSEEERYHLHLLNEISFIRVFDQSGNSYIGGSALELSRFAGATMSVASAGHDYLDAIRDEGIWQKTKEGAAKMGGVTLGIMKDIAVVYMKEAAAEKLGITL